MHCKLAHLIKINILIFTFRISQLIAKHPAMYGNCQNHHQRRLNCKSWSLRRRRITGWVLIATCICTWSRGATFTDTALPFHTVAILSFRYLMTPTFPVLRNAAPRLWNDFAQIFCWDQELITVTRQRNGLSGSNAVHPLKYLCPISVLRIERRESVTVEIGRPIIDATPYICI